MSSDMLEEMKSREHSYREWDPEDFIQGDEEGASKFDLQTQLRRIEDGRFYTVLDRSHLMFTRLDDDEQEEFVEGNPDLGKWLHTFGVVEEATTFEWILD